MSIQKRDFLDSFAMKKFLIKDIMTQPAVSIDVDASFHKVEEMFIKNGIRHLPVIDDEGTLIGLITKRDLFRIVSPRIDIEDVSPSLQEHYVELKGGYYMKESLDQFILEHVMIKEVITLNEENSAALAVEQMIKHRIGCVVIIDDARKVKGIVTRYDILKLTDKLLKQTESN